MQKKDRSRDVRAEADIIEAPPAAEITILLREWNAGNEQAFEKLADLLYRDLHRAAHKYIPARGGRAAGPLLEWLAHSVHHPDRSQINLLNVAIPLFPCPARHFSD